MLRILILFLSVLIIGCEKHTELELAGGNEIDIKDAAKITAEVLDYWDSVVGYRDPTITIRFKRVYHPNKSGQCFVNKYGWTRIAIYTNEISDLPRLRTVLLHELVHAHLTCTDADHNNDPNSIMYHSFVTSAKLDRITLEQLGVYEYKEPMIK